MQIAKKLRFSLWKLVVVVLWLNAFVIINMAERDAGDVFIAYGWPLIYKYHATFQPRIILHVEPRLDYFNFFVNVIWGISALGFILNIKFLRKVYYGTHKKHEDNAKECIESPLIRYFLISLVICILVLPLVSLRNPLIFLNMESEASLVVDEIGRSEHSKLTPKELIDRSGFIVNNAVIGWPVWDNSIKIRDYADKCGLSTSLTLDLGGANIDLVLVPAGKFLMGSPNDEKGKDEFEHQHFALISQPFYIGMYEITQEQWECIMGDNPSTFIGKTRPVESISWLDANLFIEKANCGFSLPTEEQWEWACRAGTSTTYYLGNNITDLRKSGWFGANYEFGNAHEGTSPVGLKLPNKFNIYDMHGNVAEYCADLMHDYRKKVIANNSDYVRSEWANARILRGGFWSGSHVLCRSAARLWGTNTKRNFSGFRVVINLANLDKVINKIVHAVEVVPAHP